MRRLKLFIYKNFPGAVSWYHFALALSGALWYGFPSRRLHVIGVTGTKGKTTTSNLIAELLQLTGHKTGLATTVNFKIGEREWQNETRQTMLGRFRLQSLIHQMAREQCEYGVIETSSEGILQHRQRFIRYKTAVFTNLFPEHLDRHGSFENYRAAKLTLFKQVARERDGIGVYNLDDENVRHFIDAGPRKKFGYTMAKVPEALRSAFAANSDGELIEISNISYSPRGTAFVCNGRDFKTDLLGEFNMRNIAAAIAVSRSENISWEDIQRAASKLHPVPGRLEVVDAGQPFTVIIDYAYDPNGLRAALSALTIFNPKRIIALTGIAAIGRDRWQWEKMGEIARSAADAIVITTDDPGDLPPRATIDAVLRGALLSGEKKENEQVFAIIDRREAIQKALSLARPGDVVLLAGKGGETAMKMAGGKKIPWNERSIVQTILRDMSSGFIKSE